MQSRKAKPESKCYGCQDKIGISRPTSAKLLALPTSTIQGWWEKIHSPSAVLHRRRLSAESVRKWRSRGGLEIGRIRTAEYRKKNREHVLTLSRATDKLRRLNPKRIDWISRNRKKLLAENPSFRISCAWRVNMANNIRREMAGAEKHASTVDLLGCSIQEYMRHLESKFKPGMTWENYGRNGWHMDHIKPCCSFDLTTEAGQRACFHYSNIQPLWARENMSKGGRTP